MEDKTLRKLEYDKIIAALASQTSFACGKELALALLPAATLQEGEAALKETDEGREILRLYPVFSLGPVMDIRPALRHMEIGGILDIEALVQLADICRAARQIKTFFNEIKGSYPSLSPLGKGMHIIKTIESAVEKTISPEGEINDSASERLLQIRRKIKAANERIKDRLENLIKNPNTAKYLQEPIITLRENRYVVPVRQEHRPQIPGLVHDISASGASVFVEPMAVVELNNELQKLAHEEAEEIAAILRALTLMAAGFANELEANLSRLAHLDFIMAKAKLSLGMEGNSPRLNQQGQIHLKRARHPLIDPAKVVPIDVHLKKSHQAMVITGPNTGGKTVTLKTIGLLTLMAAAGLHIPAESGSEVCFFSRVYADIGDEQSIEQSLSTFSSHMVNIVEILRLADADSLVLLDELGAGTDPTEGAALAMAIISTLQKRGSKIVATTHYSELKAFAYNTPGCINASVEFDIHSLAPTYRLMMGIPGKSNAFEISRRLGLPDAIIQAAGDLLEHEDAQVGELLQNLEELRQQMTAEKEEFQSLQNQLKAKEEALEKELQQGRIQAAEEERKANIKAQKILEESREKSEKLYQEFKQRLEEEKSAERAWQESHRKFKNWQQELEEALPKEIFKGEAPKKVQIGQTVYIPRIDQHGSVLSEADSQNQVAVQVGILKLMLKLEDLRPSAEQLIEKRQHQRKRSHMQIEKAARMQSELHLRGMETDEALETLDKYLDDAFIAGLKTVRIVHGKGAGILRSAVKEHLQRHRLVKAYRLGDYHEGGNGVTIAELDL